MPSKARQKKNTKKLNRVKKYSILGPQNLGSGGLGPPGSVPVSFSMCCAVQGVYRNRASGVVKYRTSENLTLGKSRMK